MKFLHCADIHLDSPLLGLELQAGDAAAEFRLATRRAFSNVVTTAIERAVDFVLIAGDIYDLELKGYESPLFFNREMMRLKEAGIPVAMIFGNHDFAAGREFALRLPENVHRLGEARPESHQIREDVWVHGQSLPRRHVSENIARNYPPAVIDAVNIGILHTSLAGEASHEAYAPCSLNDLVVKGYDYWALGHIHARHTVSEAPRVEYPGCTQGRHFRETGEKGCLVVEMDPTTKTTTSEFVNTAAALWAAKVVNASGARTFDEVLERASEALRQAAEAAGDRPVAVRLTIGGTTAAHAQLCQNDRLRNEVLSAAADGTWVERIQVETRPEHDSEALLNRNDPFGEIARTVRAARSDPSTWQSLSQELSALRAKLPAEARAEPEPLELDPNQLGAWLPQVEADLVARIAELVGEGKEEG